MTWMVNGAVYTTDTPYGNKTDYYVFTATSTITVDASDANDYQCILTFGQPTEVQYDWIATNAPDFTDSCSAPGKSAFKNKEDDLLSLVYYMLFCTTCYLFLDV